MVINGAHAFSHDMLLNISLISEWKTIAHNKEELVNNNLLKSINGALIMIILLDNES